MIGMTTDLQAMRGNEVRRVETPWIRKFLARRTSFATGIIPLTGYRLARFSIRLRIMGRSFFRSTLVAYNRPWYPAPYPPKFAHTRTSRNSIFLRGIEGTCNENKIKFWHWGKQAFHRTVRCHSEIHVEIGTDLVVCSRDWVERERWALLFFVGLKILTIIIHKQLF